MPQGHFSATDFQQDQGEISDDVLLEAHGTLECTCSDCHCLKAANRNLSGLGWLNSLLEKKQPSVILCKHNSEICGRKMEQAVGKEVSIFNTISTSVGFIQMFSNAVNRNDFSSWWQSALMCNTY